MIRQFRLRQYFILLSEGIRRTLTGSREAQAGSGDDGSRTLLGAVYSLTLSTLVAGLLYQDATQGQFLFVTITLSMIFTAIAVIGELAEGLFNPKELAVTGHLPIPGITRFMARLSELFLTLIILTLNLNLVPAILLFFKVKYDPIAPFICLATALGAAVFTAAVCLILYLMLARFLSTQQFQNLLLYLTILVSLGILGLLCNIGRVLESEVLDSIAKGIWPSFFPSAWFAALALKALDLPGGDVQLALAASLTLIAAALLLFFATLRSENLFIALSGGSVAGRGRSAPGLIMRTFERLFVRPEEKWAFEFTAVNFARDRGFRLKAYPILGLPVLIITLSLFENRHPLFFIFMLYLMNLYQVLVLSFLSFGDHFKAAWIFDALPVGDPKWFSRGAEKAFIYRIALPLFFLNVGVLAWVWSPLPGFLNALYAFLVGLFVVGYGFRRSTIYPFSREFKGSVSQEFQKTLLPAVLSLALAGVQYASFSHFLFFGAQIFIMLLLHKLRFALLARKFLALRKEVP